MERGGEEGREGERTDGERERGREGEEEKEGEREGGSKIITLLVYTAPVSMSSLTNSKHRLHLHDLELRYACYGLRPFNGACVYSSVVGLQPLKE